MAQAATLRARFGGLLLVAFQCLVFCGCDTGSRNDPSTVVDPPVPFGAPFLTDLLPGDGCGGDGE